MIIGFSVFFFAWRSACFSSAERRKERERTEKKISDKKVMNDAKKVGKEREAR